MQKQVKELFCWLAEIKRKSWRIIKKEIAKAYADEKQLLDWDKYHINFGDSIYDEIHVDWYSLSIYDIYFDNDYINNDNINNNSNGNDDVIYDVLITLEVNEREMISNCCFLCKF